MSLAAGLCLAALVSAGSAHATEGGNNLYLLGSGGPQSGVAPPLEGIYASQQYWVYDGDISAQREFILNGKVVAGLDATIVAQFNTLMWVPSTNFLGGTLSVAAVLPVGAPMLDASAVLTGPGGNELNARRRDSTLTVGDPVGMVSLGWNFDKFHVQAGTLVNFPVGHYREDRLANISLHRWAVDTSLAASWNDPASGWDLSAKAGVTFNGKNDYTDYNSGNEFHLEGSIEKALSPKFAAGIQGYYYKQISADTGSGARLGAFKGEVAAVGGSLSTNAVLGGKPTTFRLQGFYEFAAKRRLEGVSILGTIVVPVSLKMPPAAQ